MADNVAITPGSGATIACDEVVDVTLGTVKVQYVKLMDGTLDGTNKATVNSTGLKVDASGAAVPITDNSGSLTVDNAGTFATQATLQAGSAIVGKVSAVDSAGNDATDTTNHAIKVNVVAGAAGGTSSSFGSATPATGTAIGFSDGTNMVAGRIKGASTAPSATDPAIVVAISPNSVNANGANTSANSAPVVPATDWVGTTALSKFSTGYYVTVAASQTATVLQSSAGATGDYVSGILVIPATTSPGNVLLLDNATSITVFTGGATSVSNLVPFLIPLGAVSRSGAWKLTTGSNVSCVAIGKFS